MKKLFIISSFTLNFVLIGGGLLLLYEKRILHKALRIIFYEGRVPYLTPSYAMNRYYETRKALFKVQRDLDRPVLLLGDSHTAIPDWTALLGAPQIAARGIEGDTTIGLIARLRDYNDINSRNVVIWIGTNDVMQGEKAKGVAKRIMEAARRKADVLKKSFTTESTEDEAGLRLAGQAGVAFSNPSTSGLARDSENSPRTRSASSPAGAAVPLRTDGEGLIADGSEDAEAPNPRPSPLDPRLQSPTTSYSLPDTAPQAQVFVLGILPMATWVEKGMERNATIREINVLLAEGADENGYRFIELESLLADENGFLRGDMTSDGVHLSAKGYEAVLGKMKESGLF
jgi:lysophospholipase L1-like esterase